jgi:hypothetical protein
MRPSELIIASILVLTVKVYCSFKKANKRYRDESEALETDRFFGGSGPGVTTIGRALWLMPRDWDHERIDSKLRNFSLDEPEAWSLHIHMLRYTKYDYLKHYEEIVDGEERQVEFFENVFSHLDDDLCDYLFSPMKLANNPTLANKIFMVGVPDSPGKKRIVYNGKFFGRRVPSSYFADIYKRDSVLAMVMLEHAVNTQMGNVHNADWLAAFLEVANLEDGKKLFHMILDGAEMIPEFLGEFYKSYPKDPYFSENFMMANLPDDEMHIRCALITCHPELGRGNDEKLCNDFLVGKKVEDRAADLIGLGEVHRDRAFYAASSAFLLKYSPKDINEEMLSIEFKVLAPISTRALIEHEPKVATKILQQLPIQRWPASSLSLFIRLDEWLRSGVFHCHLEQPISYEELQGTLSREGLSQKLSLNRRLSEPIEDIEGRRILRVADAVIHMARGYASEMRGKDVSEYDDHKLACLIMAVPYLLSEGRRIVFYDSFEVLKAVGFERNYNFQTLGTTGEILALVAR